MKLYLRKRARFIKINEVVNLPIREVLSSRKTVSCLRALRVLEIARINVLSVGLEHFQFKRNSVAATVTL